MVIVWLPELFSHDLQEKPIVACLDADLMSSGLYCSFCLRSISKGTAIHVPIDPFQVYYCSQECKTHAEEQYQSLLFNAIPPATPANPTPKQTAAQKEERKNAQEAFATLIKGSGRTAALLIIRFVGQLLADEHHKLLGSEMKYELPQVDKESKLTYSFYDYIERLRSIEIKAGEHEETEMPQCRTLLKLAVEGLEEFLDDEKYLTLKGKFAYNSFGVTYDGGRKDRVCFVCNSSIILS
jgi:import receptor subunit TOM20